MQPRDSGRVQDKILKQLERQERKQAFHRDRFFKFKLPEIHNLLSQKLLMSRVIETDNPSATLSSPPTTTATPKERKIRLLATASVIATSGGRTLYQGGELIGWDRVARLATRQIAKKTTAARYLRIGVVPCFSVGI